ncbi:DUF2971 domain-containing protein [Streptomyces sp. NPDC004435]|uniref:DUF2971 domain-containing protein n=1 Tax=Streptomyces sp. NPDC004435 TaxID=3364701 RepID=UPI0036BCE591
MLEDLDQHLRLRTKVGCLTRDFVPAPDIRNRDAARGWSHLALWSHYGDKYASICLRLDQDKLLESFLRHSESATFAFHGPVRYLNGQNPASTISDVNLGQVKEFGADAAARAYAAKNKDPLPFRKHSDWAYESGYRLVLLTSPTTTTTSTSATPSPAWFWATGSPSRTCEWSRRSLRATRT